MKTSFQTQKAVGWEAEYISRSGCEFWMGIDNFPELDCKVLGRIYYPQDDTDRVVSMGSAGADIVFDRAEPIIKSHPNIYAWILLNEASIWNPIVRAGFPAFNQRLTYRLASIGKRHVCGNVNVGHPSADYWEAGINAIGEACRGAYALGLHGYSWPSLMNGWVDYVGRFERIYISLRANGYNPPPCILTEIGLDRAVYDGNHAGWRMAPLTSEQLRDQVAEFEARVKGNSDLLGALWFLSGAGSPWDYLGFDVDRDTAMLIADISEPEYAFGVDVSEYQGDISWGTLKTEGVQFAFIRWGKRRSFMKMEILEPYRQVMNLFFSAGVVESMNLSA